MDPNKFQALLAKAKALAAKRAEEKKALETSALAANFSKVEAFLTNGKPDSVDLTNLGIPNDPGKQGEDEAADILVETISGMPSDTSTSSNPFLETPSSPNLPRKVDLGVARKVTLNTRQQLFADTLLEGEDCCLIGSAGTGKTTCVGVAVRTLVESGRLKELGSDTKWLRSHSLGVLVTSFTRKAVNNIRRAVPEELKAHTLTLHKVLEFQPVFYDIVDPADPTRMKKTMKFEPTRHALNPLPSGLTLVLFEESSMIGTDLYGLYAAAVPHGPQEVFIGDIRQLPPIFGPAILGFKMALLPVVELDEVYRQALNSPIIRLAHAVLSGDKSKFDPKVVKKKEKHPILDKLVDRKSVPSLQAYEEDGEFGSVKIQIWQNSLPPDVAMDTTARQFIAWAESGYYNPEDDLILCPFNKSFGTLELNRRIHNYLGRKRGAEVHQVIAGFETHYLAIGDRVLFDKEDCVILDIRRNASYMGKSPIPPSPYLDRWGAYQQEVSDEEAAEHDSKEADLADDALENFMMSMDAEEKDRVQAASHIITIRYTYSEDEEVLDSAAKVNLILGGHAITVHKAQGSEAEKVFLVLHASHATMCSQELVYTAITRARRHLHIICEPDMFSKAVTYQKVKGHTLEDKIKSFQGKTEFKEMEEELKFLKIQRAVKKRKLEEAKVLQEKLAKEIAERSRREVREWRQPKLADDLQRLDTDYDGLPVSPVKPPAEEVRKVEEVIPTAQDRRAALLAKLNKLKALKARR